MSLGGAAVAVLALIPTTLVSAQRLDAVRTAVHRPSTPWDSTGGDGLREPEQTPASVLVLGGVAGAASAGAILWAGLRNCSECDPTPILVSVLWEGTAVPMGVHLANRGRGNLAVGRSYGIEAIGIVVGAIASNLHSNAVGFVIGGSLLAWQIAVAVHSERSTRIN